MATALPDVQRVFGLLNPTPWLITAQSGAERGGLIATTVSKTSIVTSMPRMLVGIAKQHFTHELIEKSRACTLHLLSEAQLTWVWQFGLQSGRSLDKLAAIPHRRGSTGSPILTDALGWLECQIEVGFSVGDRTLFLGEVVAGGTTGSGPALCWQRLAQLAPADKLQQLREMTARDALQDEAAILAWRQARE